MWYNMQNDIHNKYNILKLHNNMLHVQVLSNIQKETTYEISG